MGDTRYDRLYERVAAAEDRAAAIRSLGDAEVLQALAGASKRHDPYVSNVLATEALNRHRRRSAVCAAVSLGAAAAIGLRTLLLVFFAVDGRTWADEVVLLATTLLLLLAGGFALAAYRRALHRDTEAG